MTSDGENDQNESHRLQKVKQLCNRCIRERREYGLILSEQFTLSMIVHRGVPCGRRRRAHGDAPPFLPDGRAPIDLSSLDHLFKFSGARMQPAAIMMLMQ